jgi:uncharacterized repeat protein (TIGR02543 family)
MYGRTMPTIDSRGFMENGIPATEIIRLNDTEEWDIINTTVDAHPMHLHLVQFQVIDRQPFDPATLVSAVTDTVNGIYTQPQYTNAPASTPTPPAAWEAGWKDTIDCPPGMVTRVKAKFDIAGDKYVWHCHILSHEEHDMMRPLVVVGPLTVTFTTSGNGTISGTTPQSVPYATNASAVTAVPNTGYHFTGWLSTSGTVTANPLTVTNVTSSQTFTATFAIDTFTVNFLTDGHGTIDGTANQTVAYLGSATTVTALPVTGYHFVNWTGTNGFVTTTSNPLTVTGVTAAMDITANFAVDTFAVNFIAATGGTVSGTPNQTVSYLGSTTTVTAMPDAGYTFVNWTGTGGFVTTSANPLTVTNVTAAIDITANFAPSNFTVTFTSGRHGSVNGSLVQ